MRLIWGSFATHCDTPGRTDSLKIELTVKAGKIVPEGEKDSHLDPIGEPWQGPHDRHNPVRPFFSAGVTFLTQLPRWAKPILPSHTYPARQEDRVLVRSSSRSGSRVAPTVPAGHGSVRQANVLSAAPPYRTMRGWKASCRSSESPHASQRYPSFWR